MAEIAAIAGEDERRTGSIDAPKASKTKMNEQSDTGSKLTVGMAVLAFENLSTDPALDRIGEVIAEQLITALSRFQTHSIVSRTSSFAVSGEKMPMPIVGEMLSADYIVEGSLRPVGTVARVTIQLIDAKRDQHAWAGTFDWDIESVTEDQDIAVSTAAGQVSNQLSLYEAQIARAKPIQDLTALQCFFRGYATFISGKPEARDEAKVLFERAVELNPDFWFARSLLSYSLSLPKVILNSEGKLTVDRDAARKDLERAEQEALKALETSSSEAPVHLSLARVHTSHGRPEQGIGAAQAAIEINPHLPAAYLLLAEAYLANGQPEDAIEPLDKYIRLGSSGILYWIALSTKALALTALGRHDEAISCSRDAQARSASAMLSFFGEICALGHLGRLDDAKLVIERAQRNHPGFCSDLFEALFRVTDANVAKYINAGFKRAGFV